MAQEIQLKTMATVALLEDTEQDFTDREEFLAQDDDWPISRFRSSWAVLLKLCVELRPFSERDTAMPYLCPYRC